MDLKCRVWFPSIAAVLSGGLLTTAFAPTQWIIIGPISLICLRMLWENRSTQSVLTLSYLFGLGFFGWGVSWIYYSLHQYGGLVWPLALLVLFSLVSFLSLFLVFQAFLLKKIQPLSNRLNVIGFPCLWTLFEWLRSHLFTGFPWLLLGYTATHSVYLRGYAPLIGVFGLSFLLALMAELVTHGLLGYMRFSRVFLVILSVLCLGIGLDKIHWVQPAGQPVKVALLQGNIDQSFKWEIKVIQSILSTYAILIKQSMAKSRIIVLPEAAIPIFASDVPHYLKSIDRSAQDNQAAIILGIPFKQSSHHFSSVHNSNVGLNYYNGIITLGKASGYYMKRHLVPLGEYMPEAWILRQVISAFIKIPMSNFIAGPYRQPLLQAIGIKIAPFICYEIAYEDLVLNTIHQAQVLLVVSDDSWFGRSSAASQHLQIAQMRALETGRYLLFSTNTGITAVIDSKGRVLKRLPLFKQGILDTQVVPMSGKTPIVYWGTRSILLVLLILLGCLFL